jgi:hypothetical protein
MPKKLFSELEPTSTQDNMEELLGLCSGRFTGLYTSHVRAGRVGTVLAVVLTATVCCLTGDMGRLMDPALERSRTGLEDELLGLCSGKFISQPVNLRSLEQDEAQSQPTQSPPK